MNQAEFQQMKLFIFNDIRREIALAKVSQSEAGIEALAHLGITSGVAGTGVRSVRQGAERLRHFSLRARARVLRQADLRNWHSVGDSGAWNRRTLARSILHCDRKVL
jgi:hypothetical protein